MNRITAIIITAALFSLVVVAAVVYIVASGRGSWDGVVWMLSGGWRSADLLRNWLPDLMHLATAAILLAIIYRVLRRQPEDHL